MRRFPALLVNLVLAALVIASAAWSVTLVRDTKTTPASATTVAAVARGTITATAQADGTVHAASTATAAFTQPGTVAAIAVQVGDKVTKGQVLAKLDPAAARRDLALAEALEKAAEDALALARTVPGADLTVATNAVTQARMVATNARAAVTGTDLTAPMAGTVVAVNGTLGDSASAEGDDAPGFVELADLTRLRVAANFGEADAARLRVGLPATVVWSALTGAESTGRVLSLNPAGTSANGVVTYGATVSLNNPPPAARPGQSVRVTVATGTVRGAVIVDSAAVTSDGDQHSVVVRNHDGTTARRAVRVGVRGVETYEIKSGLSVGEQVVLPAGGPP
ncbi:efflux RND transporter periplasmic adaptor subunit [Actinoplanes solisilvae]|uniref:efflux RND transporter periplasmic adaptor subunit n=1 Tax=Actinoplanes solisilvae TaxID=2486853 RepID=UPI000FD76D16|nr:efflux RND transporter periplasmic adaptor subunit [Actinoplanes solisilvae]